MGKVAGASYGKVVADPETGLPDALGLASIQGFSSLMRDNKDCLMFPRMGAAPTGRR